MKLAPFVLAGGVAFAALATTGCVEREVVVHRSVVEVDRPPPPPPREELPPPPGPPEVFVWQPGHWRWDGHEYYWQHGHWERRPERVSQWIPPHWDERGGRWVFVEGYWR